MVTNVNGSDFIVTKADDLQDLRLKRRTRSESGKFKELYSCSINGVKNSFVYMYDSLATGDFQITGLTLATLNLDAKETMKLRGRLCVESKYYDMVNEIECAISKDELSEFERMIERIGFPTEQHERLQQKLEKRAAALDTSLSANRSIDDIEHAFVMMEFTPSIHEDMLTVIERLEELREFQYLAVSPDHLRGLLKELDEYRAREEKEWDDR